MTAHFSPRDGVESARAADAQRPLFLAVQVQKILGLQQAAGELRGAGQATFLVDGEEELQRAVGAIGALHHGERGGDTYAVVGAQGGAVRLQPIAVADQANGIAVEVVGGAFVFLADHVQVALQDGRHSAFAAGTGGLADHDVANRVRGRLQAQAGGLSQYITARQRLFFGGARDRRESLEVPPQGLGLQILQYGFHDDRLLHRDTVQVLRCYV